MTARLQGGMHMIRRYLSERFIVIILFLIALFVIFYDSTCSAEESMLYLKQEAVRLKEQRTSLLQSETKIRGSLDRVRKASELVGSQANPEERLAVREAASAAEESYSLVRNLRAKIEMRLRALESVVRGQVSEKSFGIATIQLGGAQKRSGAGVGPVQYGTRIFEEETVSTGTKGVLELFTPDSGYLTLAPDTTVRMAEFDHTTSLLTLDIERGKVHAEKVCPEPENDTARCWATRYRTPSGFISFGKAELVYELKQDGTEMISVLEGAVVYREKQSKKASTVRMGEQLILGPRGESATIKKLPKEGVQNWWDVDLQFEM